MPETKLEAALGMIVDVYHKYSLRVDGTRVLTLNGFTRLVTEQMPDLFKILGDGPRQEIIEATFQDKAEDIFKEYDANHDYLLSFEEFTNLLSKILIYNEMSWMVPL